MKSKERRLRPGRAAAIMLAAGAALLLLTAKHLMSFRAKTAEQKEQNPVEDASGEIRERAGMIGRLVIPDVGVDAALFESSADAASRQKVVDAMDSALYIPGTDGERDIIADHARQGFAQMEKAVPGKTLLYLNGSGTTKVFRCTTCEVGSGTNTGSDLLGEDGKSILVQKDGNLILYTCHGLWKSVSYTVWEPVRTILNRIDTGQRFGDQAQPGKGKIGSDRAPEAVKVQTESGRRADFPS